MPLVSLRLPPGTLYNGTLYQAKGRWRDAQLVRFLRGTTQPVGGWLALSSTGASLAGYVRAMLAWLSDTLSAPALAVATNTKLFTLYAGVLTDRTPSDIVTGQANTTFGSGGAYGSGAYGNGKYSEGDSTQTTVTPASMWHLDTFGNYLLAALVPSDARPLVWDLDADTLQQIGAVAATGVLTASGVFSNTETLTIGAKTYTLQTTLTNSDGNIKIGATTAETLENIAAAINLSTGAGTKYAAAMTVHPTVTAPSYDSTTLTVRAKRYGANGNSIATTETCANASWGAATLAGGDNGDAPTSCSGLVVTNERFLFLLGVARDPDTGVFSADARSVVWASQESLTEWDVSDTTTAGDFKLPGEGELVCGRRGRNETLLWTTDGLFSAQYIGGTLLYSVSQLGQRCGIIGPNACIVVDGRAVWMSHRNFFVYDGYVRPVPSQVSDFVFQNFNESQSIKCFAQARSDYGEVTFFYPSATSMECDRYVTWNYWEDHWTHGRLARTAGVDRGVFDYPLMASATPALFYHENGWDHTGETAPYLVSGPIELDEGDRVMMVRQVVPDEATQDGQELGSLQGYLKSAFYPDDGNENPEDGGWGTVFSLANPTSVRVTGRQVRLKLAEASAGDWRLGVLRLDVTPRGKR